ncbi:MULTISPECIES: GNAT family N-acetyltransferase [unclassified Lysinibacillus]|uniref:GNAT family N-acetyltransferase n=1 Tax=unclassified Lysinibacillus TaxID=2636778 RepID=UPI0008861950|nr:MULTISPECIES: GNAT family N-acetyltransferase [unclassified Lysinibacillus]SCY05566.1 Acetyltransferase (GNAT) domain-containing protein [Lysinibacillus sp. SG9]SDB14126.1 Acetyltransferase (GNAT) domain-containing protein [Lysinibacillus sp. TC-37]SFS53074.1 Acetyltransferase (GNAT) domain-containing protein [Lysinibacillus sp. SG55]
MSHIKEARMEHLQALCTIDQKVIGDASRTEEIQQAIEEKRCLLYQSTDNIAGFLLFTNDFFGYSFISLVIVKPSDRRKGVASALMKAYMQMAKTSKVFSSTNQSNKRMQQLFHNLGFVKSGVIDNLDEGDPEIIYMKQASPQA